MYRQVTSCRICGNTDLLPVLNLGHQTLTGVFPRTAQESLTRGPLILVKCTGAGRCGLLQLQHSYTLSEMYGANYGYRSGLNPSMVAHLRSKVERIKSYGVIYSGDIILDIGSNDGTTLRQYALPHCRLVGMDPTGSKFIEHYTSDIELIADFFSAETFQSRFGTEKAKVVTSFSMFYDLEDPVDFMRQVSEILHDEGIWVLEQSYMPLMLDTNSYDTVCHEHLEYYALAQITWMAERAELEVVDVELNDVNGGSFSLVIQKKGGKLVPKEAVASLRSTEALRNLDSEATYGAFSSRVEASRMELLDFLNRAKAQGKRVAGLGASTKGNVLLQYCGIDSSLVYAIGEVNPDKFGAVTPGSKIPIVDEKQILSDAPDYVLVLPWHFRGFFDSQPRYANLNLVYPLPSLSFR